MVRLHVVAMWMKLKPCVGGVAQHMWCVATAVTTWMKLKPYVVGVAQPLYVICVWLYPIAANKETS